MLSREFLLRSLETELRAEAKDARRNHAGRRQEALIGDLLAVDGNGLHRRDVVLRLIGVAITDIERVEEDPDLETFVEVKLLLEARIEDGDIIAAILPERARGT